MKIDEQLIGKSVMTVYNKKVYRIDRIEYDKNPTNKFEKSDGTSITFKDYYQDAYKHTIKDLDQPLLVHVDEKKNEV